VGKPNRQTTEDKRKKHRKEEDKLAIDKRKFRNSKQLNKREWRWKNYRTTKKE